MLVTACSSDGMKRYPSPFKGVYDDPYTTINIYMYVHTIHIYRMSDLPCTVQLGSTFDCVTSRAGKYSHSVYNHIRNVLENM